MNITHKQTLIRLVAGSCFFALALLLSHGVSIYIAFCLFFPPYVIIGGDVLYKAARNIIRGQVFDENFLMCTATIGAFCLGQNSEAVAVMLFYQVGELFQSYAVNRSRRSIASLMDIRPDHANLERGNEILTIGPDEVSVNDIIIVKAGERIPLDGVVESGSSQLDMTALTGEPLPRDVSSGDEVVSGSVNISGLLRIRVTKLFAESTVSRILELVESAGDRKAKSEQFITRFARYYTPVVVIVAAALAVVPPLLFAQSWGAWVERGLIFLVVSCPCALVISVPLSFFGGIGGASARGILVKGGNYLEALAKMDMVVFDKTGTLTTGSFTVVAVHPEELSERRLLELAACAESYSNHPVSQSVVLAYGKPIDKARIENVRELAGQGVLAMVDTLSVLVGNSRLMEENHVGYHDCHLSGTALHIAVNGRYEGHIIIADTIKPDAKQAIFDLKRLGVRKTVMLTGDRENVAAEVAGELGVDEYHAGLLPQDKVDIFEGLLLEKRVGTSLVFVGDGINDAPVLARADVGVAMGAMGSDAAIEAADVVLMDDKPGNIVLAVKIARGTLAIVRQNIVFALGVKGLVLLLAAFGAANMWEAVFADVGVAVIAILNSMRALRIR